MILKNFRFLVFLSFFYGCSPRFSPSKEQPKIDVQGTDPSAQSQVELESPKPEEVDNQKPDENSFELKYERVPPENLGQPWKRRIRLENFEAPQDLKVEKKVRDPEQKEESNWEPAGFLSSTGEYIDSELKKDSKYRVGGQVETPWLKAAFDLNLSEGLQNCEGEIELKALRIHVPEGKNFELGPCHLTLKAGEIHIDGKIVSLNREQKSISKESSDSVGLLRLVADKIFLKGQIDLSGVPGQDGQSFIQNRPLSQDAKEPLQWQVSHWEESETYTYFEDVPVVRQRVETKIRTVEYDEWVKVPLKYTNLMFWSLPAMILGVNDFNLVLQKKTRQEPYQEVVSFTETQKVQKSGIRKINKNNLDYLKNEAQKLVDSGELDGNSQGQSHSGEDGKAGGPGANLLVLSPEPLDTSKVKLTGGPGGERGLGSPMLKASEPKIIQIVDPQAGGTENKVVSVFKGKPGPAREPGKPGKRGANGKDGELLWIATDSLTLKSLTGFE